MIRTADLLFARLPMASSAIAGRLLALNGAETLPGPTHRGLPSEPSAGRLRAVSVRDPWSWHVEHYHRWLDPDGTPGDRLRAWGAEPHADPVEQMRRAIALMVRPDRHRRVHVGAWPAMLDAPAACHRLRCGLLSWGWRAATGATPSRPMGTAGAVLDATRPGEAVAALAEHIGAALPADAETHDEPTAWQGDPRDMLGADLCALIEKREAIALDAWTIASETPRGLWLLTE
jgi:hypothetical protein